MYIAWGIDDDVNSKEIRTVLTKLFAELGRDDTKFSITIKPGEPADTFKYCRKFIPDNKVGKEKLESKPK
jgi:hypothetical protein